MTFELYTRSMGYQVFPDAKLITINKKVSMIDEVYNDLIEIFKKDEMMAFPDGPTSISTMERMRGIVLKGFSIVYRGAVHKGQFMQSDIVKMNMKPLFL